MRLLVTGGSGFIGTNLVARALGDGHEVVNLDVRPPRDPAHRCCWRAVDILDAAAVEREVRANAPTHAAHLAAVTDTLSSYPPYYAANTTGTGNVLRALARAPGLERVLSTSSQFVCRPGVDPVTDDVYDPHTVYGWSKVVTEQLTRAALGEVPWTVVRPTTIWGPWSDTHPARMVRTMRRGLYVHPDTSCIRAYGYVENVVFQMMRILEAPLEAVNRRVFYVGDRLIELGRWVDTFALAVTGRPARRSPYAVMKALALAGDVVTKVRGAPALLQSGRFRTMTEDYPVPMEPIFALAGEPPYTLDEAVRASLAWLDARA